MFRKTILAAMAAVGLIAAPGLGVSSVQAAHPPLRGGFHREVIVRHAPVIVRPRYVAPVCVAPRVYVAPVFCHYDVFYRANCNVPWQFGGIYNNAGDAATSVTVLQSQGFEAYSAVQ
jgi:hypothetical protein